MSQSNNFGFGEDEAMLRDSARKFFADNCSADKIHALVAHNPDIYRHIECIWDKSLWQQICELGWTAACVPESAGGIGMPTVAVVALAPGWVRTERVLEAFETDAEQWTSIPFLSNSESPAYAGRAVAALLADEQVVSKMGRFLEVGHLAREYDFMDVDGRQVAPFSELYPESFGAG